MRNSVVVVGGGNAALCAAIAARSEGAAVTLLEAAPRTLRGGNSAFSAGAMRVVYDSVNDLQGLMPDITASDLSDTEFGTYSRTQFFDDMGRLTQYRCDPDLVEILVDESLTTVRWMVSNGVRFIPNYGGQAFSVNGTRKFWGGLTIEAVGGGRGLTDALYQRAEKDGVRILYSHRALAVRRQSGRICAVDAVAGGEVVSMPASAVVLACGGFEANAEWRTRYLGPGWDLAKVRGTRFNLGDGIRIATDIGAITWGQWSGCHAVAWDQNAPAFGDLSVGDGYQKHSYPFGIMVNAAGQRFVDEGADFRNYTYAKYGRRILEQPGQVAWQIFDAKSEGLLRDEYRIPMVSKVTSLSLEDLVRRVDGCDGVALLTTIREFNAAVDDTVPFDPSTKDGRTTRGLAVNKSNWAQTIAEPPFSAYGVTCGITFTFGGLKINTSSQVIDTSGQPIEGLYACGELVGGLFYFNYPGGTGLTAGAVFGRAAGRGAARCAVNGG